MITLPQTPENAMLTPQIRVAKGPWSPYLQVLISSDQPRAGGLFVAEPLTFRPLGEDEIERPQLELNNSDAQSLMDQLWQCGLRPTEGTGSAGAMAATQSHLADLRRLVFDDTRFNPSAQP
jgi:hypothetical protein